MIFNSHSNNFEKMIYELMAFELAVETVYEWAKEKTDTLVFVTVDHETGGLSLYEASNKYNIMFLSHIWATIDHTVTNVECFLWDDEDNMLEDLIDNTDIFNFFNYYITGETYKTYYSDLAA